VSDERRVLGDQDTSPSQRPEEFVPTPTGNDETHCHSNVYTAQRQTAATLTVLISLTIISTVISKETTRTLYT